MALHIHIHSRDAREINGDIPRMAREAVAAGKTESQFRAMARAIPLEGRDLEFAMQEFARAMSNKQGSRYSLKDAEHPFNFVVRRTDNKNYTVSSSVGSAEAISSAKEAKRFHGGDFEVFNKRIGQVVWSTKTDK